MSGVRRRAWVALAVLVLGAAGCAGRAELAERRVLAMTSAMARAEGYDAYQRAERRVDDVAAGMSVAEAEAAMGAFVAVETRTGADGKPLERRATLIEGRLCVRDASERRQRWIFGYDESRVVFVGFVIEFERDDAGDEWRLRGVDRQPKDTCETPGLT